MPRPKSYPTDLRERLIRAASDRLGRTRPADLSLRELAASEGTSTNAIYTIFGGKEELIGAVVADAAARLQEARLTALGGGCSFDSVVALAIAHRRWALDHPGLYQLMFDPTALVAVPALRIEASTPLIAALERLIGQGQVQPMDVNTIIQSLLAAVHGWVILEITRPRPEYTEDAFRGHLRLMLLGFASDAERAARA